MNAEIDPDKSLCIVSGSPNLPEKETSRMKPAKSKPFNVTAPPDWFEAFRKQATAENLNLSDWLIQCCVASLPKTVAEKLTPRRTLKMYSSSRRKSGDTNGTSRINISAPEDYIHAFSIAAHVNNYSSRSDWICECGKQNLPATVARKLSERPGTGRPSA